MRELLQRVKEEKADGLLLDLSRNGGGLLDDSVEIAGFFIRNGGVVAVKNTFAKVEVYRDPDDSLVYDGPMVLLTSRISASASEIVAGAMKDYGRAIVVGADHTFGKGTVQSMVPLPKDLGGLKVTTAIFFRPGGNSTQHKGVEADIVFPSLFGASELGEKHQDYSLPAQQIDAFIDLETLPDGDTSDAEFWVPITPELIRELASRSAKRIDQSEEFQDIRRQIEETNARNGILHLSDIYKPEEDSDGKDDKAGEKAGEKTENSKDGDSEPAEPEADSGEGASKPDRDTAAQPGNPAAGQVASNTGKAVEPGDLAQMPGSSAEPEENAEASEASPQQREALQILADFVRIQS